MKRVGPRDDLPNPKTDPSGVQLRVVNIAIFQGLVHTKALFV